ncbi:GNAT family N-acetyltransferase [Desulfonatronum thioautotrophicum]|uniref:GNAT family N-acetyltransferase n=1 Tax=Desulfonatronum thioautotrophicum TaxID=617001 RepID=UPI001FC93EB1|nr:GNAT family N-acetyltransferase [Desulfonatronum thioautotrophicum]
MSRVLLLSRADLSEVVALEAEHFPAPWSLEQFQSSYDRGMCRVHGVRDGAILIGYTSCLVLPPEMEILNMAMLPIFRRRGFGRALVTAALKDGIANGISVCHLEVDETNLAALSLYSALGFTQIGRRRGYYHDPQGIKDAVLMRCELQHLEP